MLLPHNNLLDLEAYDVVKRQAMEAVKRLSLVVNKDYRIVLFKDGEPREQLEIEEELRGS